jgi:glycosyltransferase involved in cell wall biosynthesis
MTTIRLVTLSTVVWGAETTLLHLMSQVAERPGVELEMVAPPGDLVSRWRSAGLGTDRLLHPTFEVMTSDGKRTLLRRAARLTSLLSALPPTSFTHSHHQWSHLAVARQSGPRAVIDLHDVVPTTGGRALQTLAAVRAGTTLVASQAVASQLPRVIRRKATYLPRPVERVAGGRSPAAGRELRIVIVARPHPHKMVRQALTAMLPFLSTDDRVHVVGGAATDYDSGSLGSDPRVEFRGRASTTDVERELAWANLHVLSSPVEPFGRVVVEAAAAGIPSIVHRGAGASEFVTRCGGGSVVDAWGELGSSLDALRDPGRRAEAGARASAAAAEHEPSAVAATYLRLLGV